jgi:hypothetical protein
VVRERFFTPRLRAASYAELNTWLLERCIVYARAHKHPELTDCDDQRSASRSRPALSGGSTHRVPRGGRARLIASQALSPGFSRPQSLRSTGSSMPGGAKAVPTAKNSGPFSVTRCRIS